MKYIKSFNEAQTHKSYEDEIQNMTEELGEIFLPFSDSGYEVSINYKNPWSARNHGHFSIYISCTERDENGLRTHEPNKYTEKLTLDDLGSSFEYLLSILENYDYYINSLKVYNIDENKGDFEFYHDPKYDEKSKFFIVQNVKKEKRGDIVNNTNIVDFLKGNENQIKFLMMMIKPLPQT